MGTIVDEARTSGGQRGTSGGRRRLAWLLLAGFLVIFFVQGHANIGSMVADLERSGADIPASRVWVWEGTSLTLWLLLLPLIWWGVAHVRPPRFAWWQVAAILLLGSMIVSAVHIGGMVVLRIALYELLFGERYDFGRWLQSAGYEYRKDFATYLQFVALAVIAQWLLARAGEPHPAPTPPASDPVLEIADGAVVHRVPVGEVEQVVAAGNYVEVHWGNRTLLHRATLAAVEEELGARFVRIHRGRLVRRDAIRRVETDRSGDFRVTLAAGAVARGSRRYRAALDG